MQGNLQEPWSDGTFWADGTGWLIEFEEGDDVGRFTLVASGMTSPGTTATVGIQHVGLGDQRIMAQFKAAGPFAAKVLATLDYDFNANTGDGFVDVTNVFGQDVQIDAAQFFSSFSNGVKKLPEAGAAFSTISSPGFYQGPVGFFPAALYFEVTSVTSGDAITVHVGV